ncbi:Protein of unknown function DUF1847 [Solidesulfovibrio fructosivorans JJ]]|uniref:Metal-binding protein n=1 Tax=Solidesulfovibrio fructosivorans JJ] TaxID=596151 RepID=E1JYJ5_SOLFR|nr:DUF1847 domain-containing protein [Solidesulfovibrio fructosivorans]EFL50579.1 Protein of unknown function DUF1847 [Solidesulfovibrio fructosivorans JJ]]
MADAPLPQCALCPYDWSERYCRTGKGKAPKDCPSIKMRGLIEPAVAKTTSAACGVFAKEASLQEATCYGGREEGYGAVKPLKPRIVEIVEFARRMGYTRLGLVFCIGLRKEAAVVHEILAVNGFEVASVSCKVGGVSKEALGITPAEQVDPGAAHETMCNPVLQAMVVNEAHTDFNVLLGLCVGHDSLFFKHAEAMGTVLAVKDRLLGHNPIAAINQYDSYYRYLKKPLP